MKGSAFALGEIITFIVGDEVDHRTIRKRRWFVENKPSVFDACSERAHVTTVRLSRIDRQVALSTYFSTFPLLYFSTFREGSIPNVSFIQTHNGGSDDTPDAANASLLILCACAFWPDRQSVYTYSTNALSRTWGDSSARLKAAAA